MTIDGRKAQVTWSGQVHTTTTDTTTTYTRQGRVEGDVKVAGTDRTSIGSSTSAPRAPKATSPA